MVDNIEKSFHEIVKEYIDTLNLTILYEIHSEKIHIYIDEKSKLKFNSTQKIFNGRNLNDDLTSKVASIIGNTDLSIIIENKYKEEFEMIRKSRLPQILKDLQENEEEITEDYYNRIKQYYVETLKLYNIIKKYNKVQFLNIFPYLDDNNSECEKKWSKYALLINHIHTIYTIDEFKIVYKDILPFYRTKYNESVNWYWMSIALKIFPFSAI